MTLLEHIAELNVISSMRGVLEITVYFFEFNLDFKSIEAVTAQPLAVEEVDFRHSLTRCLELL